MRRHKRARGWYVIEMKSGMCHRGPYRLPETAGAVRTEMEKHCPDHWNLSIVNNVQLDEREAAGVNPESIAQTRAIRNGPN